MIGNKMLKCNAHDKQPGFTLVEILVTVSVFTIVVLISSAIFINVSSLQQQTGNIQKLQNDGRYIVERLSKEIRSRELDYSSVDMDIGLDNTTNILVFKKDEFGETLKIYRNADSNLIFEIVDSNNNAKSAPINSVEEVAVDSARFYLTPTQESPTSLDELAQPKVTLSLTIRNATGQAKHFRNLDLQTTISSKLYK